MQRAWWAHSRWYEHPTSAPTTRVFYIFLWFDFILLFFIDDFTLFLYILRAGPVGIKTKQNNNNNNNNTHMRTRQW